jgi:hypothetical protein
MSSGVRHEGSATFGGRFPCAVLVFAGGRLIRDEHRVSSEAEYGIRAGNERLLRLLEKHKVRATFFIPGLFAEHWQNELASLVHAGHDLAVHTWAQETRDQLADINVERDLIQRSSEALRHLSGRPPRGYSVGRQGYTANTVRLLVEGGFLFTNGARMHDDSPYRHTLDGQQTSLVELPTQFALDDSPFAAWEPAQGRYFYAPSTQWEIYTAEFDALATEPGRCCLLMLHSEFLRASRVVVVDRFLDHARNNPQTWFATCEELAESYIATSHPAEAGRASGPTHG